MKNDNLRNKIEQINYGQNNNEYILEISRIANELYDTSSNKKNYNMLIKKLNYQIMGGPLSDEENDILPNESNNDDNKIYIIEKDYPYHKLKQINIMSTTYMSNLNSNRGISSFNSPRLESCRNKKYTDVNANSKFYFPDKFDSIHDSDFSQWNDRSNRIKYYGWHKDINK
jgi:hypothetical protein